MEQKEVKPHPHADVYIMWIKNTNIKLQFKHRNSNGWQDVTGDPCFNKDNEYRVKPPEMVDKYLVAYKTKDGLASVTNRYYKDISDFKGSTSFGDRLEWEEVLICTKQSMEL